MVSRVVGLEAHWTPRCYVLDQARLRPHEPPASTRGFIYLDSKPRRVSTGSSEQGFRRDLKTAKILKLSSHPHASRRARCLSELLGTYLLVLVGPGTVAAVSLAQGISPFEAFLIIGSAFGAIVALVILILGLISGAHIDPAITLAHTITGKTEPEMLVPYVVFQALGGLLAGFTLRLIFCPFGLPADLGTTKLASGVSVPAGIVLEIVGTFV